MKRYGLPAALLALAAMAAMVLATPAFAQDDTPRGYPPYGMGYGMGPGMGPGYGMGYGMGPGMGPGYGMGYGMGGGRGMDPDDMPMGGWGGGWGAGRGHMWGVLSQLPADKREQLRAFHFSMRRQMIAKRAEMQQARLDLAQALEKFPLDRQAAQQAFQKLGKVRGEIFELRLTAMQQMQQIVGKELWEQMHSGAGFGPGGPGMGPGRGPGMMNR